MKKIKIAIQGELGAYSHIAANDLFKDSELKTCVTFEETFKKAHEDDTYKIIIPIENSLAGCGTVRVFNMGSHIKNSQFLIWHPILKTLTAPHMATRVLNMGCHIKHSHCTTSGSQQS